MSIQRVLPYLLLAVVLGAAGYLAGAVSDPFGPARPSVRGELAPEAPRLRQQLEQARGDAAELTGDLQRAQTTIDRLRTELDDTRTRIAELQRRAEAAEQARADAESRIAKLAERVAALEAEAAPGDRPEAPPAQSAADDGADSPNGPNAAAGTGDTGAGDTATGDTGAGDTGAGATESQNAAAGGTPPGFEPDPRPSAPALSAITPTTAQANRLLAGVEAYQDADYEAAFAAWLPLARQGYARAQLHLGALFLEGRGTERNDPLAFAWLTIARDNGSQNAGPLLQRLRDRMRPSDLEAARQLLQRARQRDDSAS